MVGPTEPSGSGTTPRGEPYTFKEFATQVERVTDDSPEPRPSVEDVFGGDHGVALREFQRRSGESPEATAYVFMGLIIGIRMAEARRDR
jgi:hypothetical protein